jgi:hypothetical protein
MQITFKGKAMKIRADFPTETLKPRRVWSVVKKTLAVLGYATQQHYYSKFLEELKSSMINRN